MKIETVIMSASNYAAEARIQTSFLSKLQSVLGEGGQVLSITHDQARFKKAYILKPPNDTSNMKYRIFAVSEDASCEGSFVCKGKGSDLLWASSVLFEGQEKEPREFSLSEVFFWETKALEDLGGLNCHRLEIVSIPESAIEL